MIPRCTVGKGITGAANYILGEGRDPKTGQLRRKPANADSRVAWIGGIGFGFDIVTQDDADLARRIEERRKQMREDAERLRTGGKPAQPNK